MILALADETIYTIIIAVIGALGSFLKMYLDYRKSRDAGDRADKAENRTQQLELAKLKSDAALRASIVGIERHKKTMTLEQQSRLSESIKSAAIEESVEDALNEHVTKVTKRKGTRFYRPEGLE